MHYVCTHNVQLYSQAGFDKSAYEDQLVANRQLKREGEPHPKIWLPDSNNEDFYMLDMPGDDKYDIQFGTGVCTDTHYDYLHTGCDSIEASRATMAVVGCPTKAYINSNYLCGVLIDIDEDYVHSVGISAISLLYPRTLVEEAQDERQDACMRVTCWRPVRPARDKCDRHGAQPQRDWGAARAAPRARCATPPCPTNVGDDGRGRHSAKRSGHDVASALRAGGSICLNPAACVCQVFMLLQAPRGSTTCPTSCRSAPRPT